MADHPGPAFEAVTRPIPGLQQQASAPARPITWDARRLLSDIAEALRGVVPSPLEVAITDHGRGIGIVQGDGLVDTHLLRPHYATIGAVDGPESLDRSIAGRVLATLRCVQDAVTIALAEPWPITPGAPDGDPSGRRGFADPHTVVAGPRLLEWGWVHAGATGPAWVVQLPRLTVHPPSG